MTPTSSPTANDSNRALGAVRSLGFDGQYWYWFSAGVPAAGS